MNPVLRLPSRCIWLARWMPAPLPPSSALHDAFHVLPSPFCCVCRHFGGERPGQRNFELGSVCEIPLWVVQIPATAAGWGASGLFNVLSLVVVAAVSPFLCIHSSTPPLALCSLTARVPAPTPPMHSVPPLCAAPLSPPRTPRHSADSASKERHFFRLWPLWC